MRSVVLVALLVVMTSSAAHADDEAPSGQPVVKQLALGTLTTFGGALPGGLWLIDCSESKSECNRAPPLIVTAVGALAGASVPIYFIGRNDREHSSLAITAAGSVAGLGAGALVAWGTMESTPFIAVTALLLGPPIGATIGFGLSRSPKMTVMPMTTGNTVGLAGTF